MPIEWHQFQWLCVTLKVTFAVRSFFVSNNSGNTVRIIYDVYTWTGKRTWLLILTTFMKTTEFRKSQPVTYTLNVVLSQKRCQIVDDTNALQTTNSKWYMTYPLETNIPVTFSHLQGHFLLQTFQCDFWPRDAMLAWYWLSSRVRLSVHLSVTSRSCTKMATCMIMQTMLNDSPGTL